MSPAMEVLRTPDERFDSLPDFDFEPHYVDAGLRMHYVDEGDAAAPTVLLLHGEPTWSFLWRHVIRALVTAGLRVIAPDLVGFGRSDKPSERSDHSYARHVGWLSAAVTALDLRDVTLVCHDWGGLLGLRLVAGEEGWRFARVVVTNTGLPTGDERVPGAFTAWRRFSQEVPEFAVGHIVNGGCLRDLTEDEIRAYDAPFPDERHKAGPRQMPILVPASPDDVESSANRAAWTRLRRWERPFLCAYSDGDPITRGADRLFLERVPGCAGQPHTTIEGGGHFVQEDRPDQLAEVVAAFSEPTAAPRPS
jgi:haloalkane dehalogenase